MKTPPALGRAKVGRPKKLTSVNSAQLEMDIEGILKAIGRSQEAQDTVLSMIASKGQREQWRGMIAVPPGGLADRIVGEFRTKTNIPLEIPFFTLLSLISGYLLKKNVVLRSKLGEIRPDIWSVILASSGAGKTYTQKSIIKGLATIGEVEFNGTGIVSSAAFVQALSINPTGVWVRDEFARYLKSIDSEQGPLAEMKDYLLRLYDNDKIERVSKSDIFSVENPALSILGLTVLETFRNYVSAESMLDGFAQRFSYIIAESDPARPWRNYPIWDVNSQGWDLLWNDIAASIHSYYIADDDVMLPAFSAAFQSLYNETIPESFFRRLMWKASKYALIYHVLRNDKSQKLTAEDYGWAGRVVSLHVQDAAWLIGEHNLGALERILISAERVVEKVARDGKKATARDLVRGVSAIRTTAQAEQILSMIERR